MHSSFQEADPKGVTLPCTPVGGPFKNSHQVEVRLWHRRPSSSRHDPSDWPPLISPGSMSSFGADWPSARWFWSEGAPMLDEPLVQYSWTFRVSLPSCEATSGHCHEQSMTSSFASHDCSVPDLRLGATLGIRHLILLPVYSLSYSLT